MNRHFSALQFKRSLSLKTKLVRLSDNDDIEIEARKMAKSLDPVFTKCLSSSSNGTAAGGEVKDEDVELTSMRTSFQNEHGSR